MYMLVRGMTTVLVDELRGEFRDHNGEDRGDNEVCTK